MRPGALSLTCGGLMTTNELTAGRYLRWLLAALSLGAGVIHLAVSGENYQLSWMHGMFFAVVGWLQISWAVAVILRPKRRLLTAGVLLNAGIIGVWVMSRVWGVPVGPEAWTPESVALADALSSGCEFGIVALSLVVLVQPAIAQHELRPRFAVPVVGAATVIAALDLSLICSAPGLSGLIASPVTAKYSRSFRTVILRCANSAGNRFERSSGPIRPPALRYLLHSVGYSCRRLSMR